MAKFGISGLSTRKNIRTAAVGVAGINRDKIVRAGEMAANVRSLLAAYEGMWTWPPPEPLPLDLLDVAQAIELKSRYQAAQLELGL
jgi:hypothetical protein